jgi:hypothetical protein
MLAGCGVLPLSLSKGQDDMKPPIGATGTIPQATLRWTNMVAFAPTQTCACEGSREEPPLA